jgi:hypothetical protein
LDTQKPVEDSKLRTAARGYLLVYSHWSRIRSSNNIVLRRSSTHQAALVDFYPLQSFPRLRLPKRYVDTVGKTANIYEIQHEGEQAFLIVPEQSVSNEDTVLKPSEEVLKPVEKLMLMLVS